MPLRGVPIGVALALVLLVAAPAVAAPVLGAPSRVGLGPVKVGSDSTARPVAIANTGTNDLLLTDVRIEGRDASEFSLGHTCGGIPPGTVCELLVTINAEVPYGKKQATLRGSSNDPARPTFAVKLSATARPPRLSVNAELLDFARLPRGIPSAVKSVTVTNTGLSDLEVKSTRITGANRGDFKATNHCAGPIEAGSSCTIDVVFSPTRPGASRVALLRILSNDPENARRNLDLRGRSTRGPPARTVEVDRFGDGTVVDDTGGLSCGASCAKQYRNGTVVTFTATPSPGWEFAHWSGCDAPAGNVCRLTANADRTLLATFRSSVTTLKANVVVLDGATLALLRQVAGTTLVFDDSASVIAGLSPGDVIISLIGNGFARRVRFVTVLTGSSIFVETEDVSLQDILREGTLVFTGQLSPGQVVGAIPLQRGARLVAADGGPESSFTITIETEVDGLTISGSATLTLEPDFAVSASLTKGINEFRSAFRVTKAATLEVSTTGSLTLVEKELPLYKFVLAPIIVGPVVLVPVVDIVLKLKGEAEVGMSASITYSEQATIGVHYLKSTGWKLVKEFSRSAEAGPPTLEASVSLTGAVAVDAEVLVYGVSGPYASLESSLEAKAVETISASELCIEWGVFLGVAATAGAKVSVLGYDVAEIDASLFDLKFPLRSGKSPTCDDDEPPSQPDGLQAVAVSPREIQLTWNTATDEGIVEGYNVRRDGLQVATTSTTVFLESRLSPNTTYCYSVTAFDQDDNESDSSRVDCARTPEEDTTAPSQPVGLVATPLSTTSMGVSWTPSVDDTRVAGYVVSRDGVSVDTVDLPETIDLGLKPDTEYCYRVAAFDDAGNTSETSDVACATTDSIGAWDVFLACQGRPYNLQNNIDLDEAINGNVQVTGTGNDYNGTPLAYVLSGVYDGDSEVLNGSITFTFQGSSCVREDRFSASLANGDSGDAVMDQVRDCGGCTAVIRFVERDAAVALPMATPLADDPDAARRAVAPGLGPAPGRP